MLDILKDIVQKHYHIDDISVLNRKEKFVEARAVFGIVARQNTNFGLHKIGKSIKRDHATILHYYKKIYESWLMFPKLNINKLQTIQIIYDNFIKQTNQVMKNNPYQKYLGKEDVLQNSVMNYIKLQYPKALVIHVPNEGKRTPFERYKFKFLGGVSGVPDILIFNKNLKYCGLAIELKVGYNKPTENQEMFLNRLKNANWDACWSNNFDSTKKIIDNYFTNIDNV